MRAKLWGIAFPAIVDDLGADRVLAEAAEMGVSEFILCSNIYAPYRLVMPRSPRQIYQLETGLTFYPANESAYSNCAIRPASTNDFADRDLFDEACKAASQNGVSTCAWVSCFANGRTANQYPQTTVQNLYGARDRLFHCFNNPEARKFVHAMVRDLVGRYPLSSVMLDKIPQSMLELRTFGGLIDPLLRFVGSICFCEHCMSQAKRDGVDLAAAQQRAVEIADASREVPQYVRESLANELHGDTEIPLFLLEEPLFADVLRWRMARMGRFVSETRDLVRSIKPDCSVSVCLVPPVKIGHDATAPRPWLCAQSYREYARSADTIHAVIHWGAEAVEYDTRRARDLVDSVDAECELCVHMAAYGRRRPEEIPALAQAALGQGADSLAFFCHDLFDDRMIAALTALELK